MQSLIFPSCRISILHHSCGAPMPHEYAIFNVFFSLNFNSAAAVARNHRHNTGVGHKRNWFYSNSLVVKNKNTFRFLIFFFFFHSFIHSFGRCFLSFAEDEREKMKDQLKSYERTSVVAVKVGNIYVCLRISPTIHSSTQQFKFFLKRFSFFSLFSFFLYVASLRSVY